MDGPISMAHRAPLDCEGNRIHKTCKSSGLLSASGLVTAAASVLVGLIVKTDGANDAHVVLRNRATAGGTDAEVIADIDVIAADKQGGEVNIWCDAPAGIYATITGTGAKALVRYVD